MPLNIDWQQILLHAFNFIVLTAILYFLLYKPVKSFMDKREAYYKSMEDEAKSKLAESEKTAEEYTEKLRAAQAEIEAETEEAKKKAEAEIAERKKQAQAEADEILCAARKQAQDEHDQMLKDIQGEITTLVADAAQKLTEDTSDSYDRFLDEVRKGESA